MSGKQIISSVHFPNNKAWYITCLCFETPSKIGCLRYVLQNVSLLVEKASLQKKFQKVYIDPSSYILGAGERRDTCVT